ncbi:MAG: hypothetical protein RJB38_2467 [Pseudomonadota bacterium]|jgi:SOS response regulatory protein OraA/RecX
MSSGQGSGASPDERLYEKAVAKLARRECSLGEMRAFLEERVLKDSRDMGADSLDRVLQRLVSQRYIDDERMGEALIREQRAQSRGPRSAWAKLRKRRVSGFTLERVQQLWVSGASHELRPVHAGEDSPRFESHESGEVVIAAQWVIKRYPGLRNRDTSALNDSKSLAQEGQEEDVEESGHSSRWGFQSRAQRRASAAREAFFQEQRRALGALIRRGYSLAVAKKALEWLQAHHDS